MRHIIIWIICFQNFNFIHAQKVEVHENYKEATSEIKIGIIGGGIGGTATAYFLNNDLKDKVMIDLYDPNVIGGRLATSSALGYEYETGGSIIHPENLYMNIFVDELGLSKSFDCEGKAGIFNGKNYSFLESDWKLINYVKAFLTYGFDIFQLRKRNHMMLKDFARIYKHQEMGLSYKNVQDLLSSMNKEFPSLLNKSLRAFLKENGLHDLIINDIATAASLANYGQRPNIHAFVGSVSLAAASGAELWSVAEGNKKVPEGLLKHSRANHIPKTVTKISQNRNKFRVWVENESVMKENYVDYDAIVIATPLTKDHHPIEFLNFTDSFRFPGKYEKIICTLVEGELNSTTFKFKEIGSVVDEILTNNPDLFYNAVGKQYPKNSEAPCSVADTHEVFKVFSGNPLSELQLSSLFRKINNINITPWLAYPHYSTSESIDLIELVPGLYYNNAIEMAASAMEMSAISAKNTALLIKDYFKFSHEYSDGSKEEL